MLASQSTEDRHHTVWVYIFWASLSWSRSLTERLGAWLPFSLTTSKSHKMPSILHPASSLKLLDLSSVIRIKLYIAFYLPLQNLKTHKHNLLTFLPSTLSLVFFSSFLLSSSLMLTWQTYLFLLVYLPPHAIALLGHSACSESLLLIPPVSTLQMNSPGSTLWCILLDVATGLK